LIFSVTFIILNLALDIIIPLTDAFEG